MKRLVKCVILLAFALAFVSCDTVGNDSGDSNKSKEESKNDQTALGNNIIKSKADLTKSAKNIIKKYYDFALEIGDRNSNSRSAAPAKKEDVASQLKKMFDVIYTPFEDRDLGRSIVKLVLVGEGADKDVNLEGKIDLANITPNVGVDAYIDLINHMNERWGGKTNYDRRTYFGSDNYYIVNDFLNVADKYASVPKLYAYGKLDINTGNAANYACAAVKFDVEAQVNKINDMIPELFAVYDKDIRKSTTNLPDTSKLPITAIKPFANVDASVALSKSNYDAWVKAFRNLPGWDDEPEYPEWDFQYPDFSYDGWNYSGHWYWYYPPSFDEWCYEKYDEYNDEYQEAYDEWCKGFYQARDEYDLAYRQAYDKYQRVYWQKEDKYWDEWDAYRVAHRKEVRDYFAKTASFPGNVSCKIDAGASVTVASSTDVPGGIIKLSLDASYDSAGKIIAFGFETMQGFWWSFLEDYDYDYKSVIRGLKNDYGIVPAITVTDYNGKQTLKLEIEDIISVIDDIVNNFGEIIQ